MNEQEKLNSLENNLIPLYEEHKKELLFHGWHHIIFVKNKSGVFAEEIAAHKFLVQSAALVHDLNYIVEADSKPEAQSNGTDVSRACEFSPSRPRPVDRYRAG